MESLHSIRQMVGPMLDAMPHPVFLVDEDVTIVALNSASRKMIGKKPELIIKRRAGEILHCIHAKETVEGCGKSVSCADCIVRNSVKKAFSKHITIREKAKMEIVYKNRVNDAYLSFITSPFEYNEKKYVLLQIENITELIELRKIIPICCVCHKIRNDSEYWHKVESYFHNCLDLNFSHGICPDCSKRLYPELNLSGEEKSQK